jgi:hypothetical protein
LQNFTPKPSYTLLYSGEKKEKKCEKRSMGGSLRLGMEMKCLISFMFHWLETSHMLCAVARAIGKYGLVVFPRRRGDILKIQVCPETILLCSQTQGSKNMAL